MRLLLVYAGDIAAQAHAGDEAALYTTALLDTLATQLELAVFSLHHAEEAPAEDLILHTERDARGVTHYRLPTSSDFLHWQTHTSSATFQEAVTQHFTAVLDDLQPEGVYIQQATAWPNAVYEALAWRDVIVVAMLHDHALLCPRGNYWRADKKPCPGPANGLWSCAACLTQKVPLRAADIGLSIPRRLRLLGLARRLMPDRHPIPRLLRRDDSLRGVILPALDGLIAPSTGLRARLTAAGFPAERIRHIPYGYPVPARDAALGDDFEDDFGLPGEALSAGYFGAYRQDQGIGVLLRAAALLAAEAPDAVMFRLHALGSQAGLDDEAFAAQVETFAAELPNVWVLGPPPLDDDGRAPDLGSLLEQVDCVVVPSLRWEVAPRPIAAAFMHDTPVIASDRGAMAEPITHEQVGGLLVPPKDERALADALLRLSQDAALLARLEQNMPDPPSIEAHAQLVLAYFVELRAAREATA